MVKASKPITAIGFKGITNLPEAAGKLLDQERQITPHVVLNADVTDGGVIQRRGGYQLTVALTNCHSLAGEESGLSIMLCVADGVTWPQSLYQVEGDTVRELCEVTSPPWEPMSYVEINNKVYIGNLYWQAAYDILAGEMLSWGVPLPPAPNIALVDGDLAPGTYSLCYTNVADGRLGGNGPLMQIKWEGGTQGIQLSNLSPGGLCWITQPNGKELFLAPVYGGAITAQNPFLQPLPTFMVQPPPGFNHFVYAFGRIWGARGKQLFYSDPSQYEWFRPQNYLPCLEEIVMVASVNSGLYVNSMMASWFLEGTEPRKMTMNRVGKGAVPGTLVYAQLPASMAGGAATSQTFASMSKIPTPVWMSPVGFVVGTHGSGNLTHLTENRLRLTIRNQGAGLYRMVGGIPQILSSLYGVKEGQDDMDAVFVRGSMYVPPPAQITGSGGLEVSGS